MFSSNETLSNIEKIALLMVSLGKESVEQLAPFFSEQEFQQISRCIQRMEEIDSIAAAEIIKEFYHKLSHRQDQSVMESGAANE